MCDSCFATNDKRLGFGFMRLPKKGKEVDIEHTCRMVDAFLKNGFFYFDTAHGYLDGKCESLLNICLTSRYPRDAYILADKLSHYHFETAEDIRPLFESQLRLSGVDYFDFYLMHAQNRGNLPKYESCRAYETIAELQAEGKIRHFGISFHDKAEFLELLLNKYPQIEVVQLQFNYIDYEDPSVESRKCYEVCRKYGKSVIVMEPVKGGSLVNLPPAAQKIFDDLGGGSAASYAIRFAAGFEGVIMVLSGMGSIEMMNDNISYMKEFQPLDTRERAAVDTVCHLLRAQDSIACTDCRYCVSHCPQHILIPDLFSCYNAKETWKTWTADFYYNGVYTKENGAASACVGCGSCEDVCPQHLPIRQLLETVAEKFEKQK